MSEEPDTAYFRKAATALYLGLPAAVADDFVPMAIAMANEVDRLRAAAQLAESICRKIAADGKDSIDIFSVDVNYDLTPIELAYLHSLDPAKEEPPGPKLDADFIRQGLRSAYSPSVQPLVVSAHQREALLEALGPEVFQAKIDAGELIFVGVDRELGQT